MLAQPLAPAAVLDPPSSSMLPWHFPVQARCSRTRLVGSVAPSLEPPDSPGKERHAFLLSSVEVNECCTKRHKSRNGAGLVSLYGCRLWQLRYNRCCRLFSAACSQ